MNLNRLIMAGMLVLPTLMNSAYADKDRVWKLSNTGINYLLAGDVCSKIGLKEWRMGRKRLGVKKWSQPSQVFSWPLQSNEAGTHQVTVLLNVPKNTPLVIKSKKATLNTQAKQGGWQRFIANLDIGKGEDVIEVALGKKTRAEIIGVEIITPSHLPVHEKRVAEQAAVRSEFDWFQKAGFGLMFQWGEWGYPKEGDKKKPWSRIYKDFDIEAFADKMKRINPGYIIWSITWRGSRFSAPLESVDEIMGSDDYTMEYDFLGKLADALHKRDIPLFLYYHPGAEEKQFWETVWHGQDKRDHFEACNIKIWTEIGNRLGTKLSGWFVDDGIVQYYPADFYAYDKALTAGNPKRLTTFNPWKFPKCSPFDDVSMGEGHAPGLIKDGVFQDGPTEGLLAHTMLIMDGPDWGIWKRNTKISSPKGNVDDWQKKVDQAKEKKHPVSFCILMYEDGTLGSKTEAILKELKR